MTLYNKNTEDFLQNLVDAGCSETVIQSFFDRQGRTKEQIGLLYEYRKSVLDDVHKYQKRLDCLDYLIYMLRSPQGENGGVG